jgi:hypothetical protein
MQMLAFSGHEGRTLFLKPPLELAALHNLSTNNFVYFCERHPREK